MRNGKPVLAIVGPGRSGKDTAAEYLRDNTILTFQGGCSFTACRHVADKLGLAWNDAWRTRHERRMEWYEIMNEYRKQDPAKLIRECLTHSDLVCGIRDRMELVAAKNEGLIDLTIWIERAVPHDPTLTFTSDDVDILVPNNATFDVFYARLRRLAATMKLLKT